MAKLANFPLRVFTTTGTLASGSGFKLYGYEAGTVTLKTFYTDATGDTAHQNPATIGSTGTISVWLGEGSYKFTLQDASGNVQDGYPIDNVQGLNTSAEVDSIADLKALEPGGTTYVYVGGYYAPGDGGGGTFYWNATSTASDDTGMIIEANTAPATGRWYRIYEGKVYATWFGAKGSDITFNNDAAFLACATYCNTNTAEMYFPQPDSGKYYMITAELSLPRFVSGQYRLTSGGDIQGANLKYTNKTDGVVKNIYCSSFSVEGAQSCVFEKVRSAGQFLVDGLNNTIGVFWCVFNSCRAPKLVIDVQNFAVNSNTFTAFVANPAGSDYGLTIKETVANGYECHENKFIQCDFSHSLGIINSTALNQTNYLDGVYLEDFTGSETVTGNFNILNGQMDATAYYGTKINNYVLGSSSLSQRTGGDYLPQTNNILVGGYWECLTSALAPICFAGGAVVADAAMPGGNGRKYGLSTSSTFQSVSFSIPAILNDGASPRASICGYWAGNIPRSVTIGAATYGTASFSEISTGYYFFKFPLRASNSTTTPVIFYVTTAVAEARSGYIGMVHVSAGPIATLPYFRGQNSNIRVLNLNGVTMEFGSVTQAYDNAGTYVDYSLTMANTYTAAPKVNMSVVPASGYEAKTGVYFILSISTTTVVFRVYYTTDWTGNIHYQIIGTV